ncbi:MAG: hypothetical protein GX601_18195 [Anaerolineales bacterium]|nr:hypothetical protein [Anaerolineales bacterium]
MSECGEIWLEIRYLPPGGRRSLPLAVVGDPDVVELARRRAMQLLALFAPDRDEDDDPDECGRSRWPWAGGSDPAAAGGSQGVRDG